MAIYKHTTKKPPAEDKLDWGAAIIALCCLAGATLLLASEKNFETALKEDFEAHKKELLVQRLRHTLVEDLEKNAKNITVGKSYRDCETDLCARLTILSCDSHKKGQAILQFGVQNETGNTLDHLPEPFLEDVSTGEKIQGILLTFGS